MPATARHHGNCVPTFLACLQETLMTANRAILYLDDETVLLDIFRDMFSDEYEVFIASTAREALDLLSEHEVDIVISDQSMPDMSGTEFLCEVAQKYSRSFRIMLTGEMLIGEAIPELSSGIVHVFITKPWQEDDLRRTLERASLNFDLRRC
jgi:DNA-binding NtrC family response regulator